jgi:hypothetical protein
MTHTESVADQVPGPLAEISAERTLLGLELYAERWGFANHIAVTVSLCGLGCHTRYYGLKDGLKQITREQAVDLLAAHKFALAGEP